MQINLRKANALQNAINDMINSITVVTTQQLNEFIDCDAKLTETSEQFITDSQRRRNLFRVLYDIRKKVAAANHRSGIDDVLTEIAYLDRMIKEVSIYANSSPKMEKDGITSRIAKMKLSTSTDVFYNENAFTSGVLTKEEINLYKENFLTLRLERGALTERLLELNITNSIVLDESTIVVLKKEKLV